VVFIDKSASEYINSQFIALKVVKNEGESKELKEKFNVPGYPTVIVLDNQGEERDRIIGFGGENDSYVQKIKDYAEGKNTLDQFVKRYNSDTLNVESNFSLAKKYINRFEREKTVELDPKSEYFNKNLEKFKSEV
jgi:thiol-disulfide isomerase/thioredoxin